MDQNAVLNFKESENLGVISCNPEYFQEKGQLLRFFPSSSDNRGRLVQAAKTDEFHNWFCSPEVGMHSDVVRARRGGIAVTRKLLESRELRERASNPLKVLHDSFPVWKITGSFKRLARLLQYSFFLLRETQLQNFSIVLSLFWQFRPKLIA